ncbi:MAG: DUF2520 domain-containing protein [Desulfuromusa sp.]|nr:DUF2520 domain-containing protein [Desulfuromusa sp.]
MKQSVALIGPGRVGCAISKRLYQAGYPMAAIISRKQSRATEACTYIGCSTELASDQLTHAATAQIILFAVPDDQIQPLALKLQAFVNLSKQTTLIHFSGLHPAVIMRHQSSAAALLSLHPLLPFADRQKAFAGLNQCPCALESDSSPALALGQKLVDAIGGQSFTLASDKKVLYHTAACIASNYLVTLIASARDLLINCDIEADQAIPLLLPLIQASLDNVKDFGPERGLTGPIVRGDTGTVADHIQALKNAAPELLPLYLQMGKITASIAGKSDRLDPESVVAMRDLFSEIFKEPID